MSKHVKYDATEVNERMTHEFEAGLRALDALQAEITKVLDVIAGEKPEGCEIEYDDDDA